MTPIGRGMGDAALPNYPAEDSRRPSRTGPISGTALPAKVSVRFENLPSESLRKLEQLLADWSDWFARRYPQGYVPPSTRSGVLGLDPSASVPADPRSGDGGRGEGGQATTAIRVWEDVPSGAPSTTPAAASGGFNLAYERLGGGEVPRYDRGGAGVQLRLGSRTKRTAEGGEGTDGGEADADAKRRKGGAEERPAVGVSEGAVEGGGLGGGTAAGEAVGYGGRGTLMSGGFVPGDEAPLTSPGGVEVAPGPAEPAPPASPRPSAGQQRCFNCGSYAHSLRDCWLPLDRARVAAARAEEDARMGGGGDRGSGAALPKRYFLGQGEDWGRRAAEGRKGAGGGRGTAESLRAEFPDVEPGHLSASLREALGISATAPPPWFGRMAAMGLPPQFDPERRDRRVEAKRQAAEEKAQEEGEECEAGASEGEEGEAMAAGEAAEVGEGEASTLGEGEGGGGEGGEGGGRDPGALEELISVPEIEESEEEGEETFTSAFFPGINAPIPEGADRGEWEREARSERRDGTPGSPRRGEHTPTPDGGRSGDRSGTSPASYGSRDGGRRERPLSRPDHAPYEGERASPDDRRRDSWGRFSGRLGGSPGSRPEHDSRSRPVRDPSVLGRVGVPRLNSSGHEEGQYPVAMAGHASSNGYGQRAYENRREDWGGYDAGGYRHARVSPMTGPGDHERTGSAIDYAAGYERASHEPATYSSQIRHAPESYDRAGYDARSGYGQVSYNAHGSFDQAGYAAPETYGRPNYDVWRRSYERTSYDARASYEQAGYSARGGYERTGYDAPVPYTAPTRASAGPAEYGAGQAPLAPYGDRQYSDRK